MKILAKSDYDSFKIHDSNREVTPSNVDRLSDTVGEYNLLDLYPIVVSKDGYILDGQNRFTMARSLGIPIYPILSNEATISDIAACNYATERYGPKDSIYVFSCLDMEPYVELRSLTAIEPRIAGGTVAGWASSQFVSKDFSRGDYIMNRRTIALRVIQAIQDVSIYHKWVLTSRPYRDAFFQLLRTSLYDHKRFLDRLSKVSIRFRPVGRVDEALTVISKIYNYNISERNNVDLTITYKPEDMLDTEIVTTKEYPERRSEEKRYIEIYKTDKFDIFKPHPCARPISRLGTLRDSMNRKPLLSCFPIIVNGKGEILDGQRRFTIAKEMNLPISYIVADDVSIHEIAIAGGVSKLWSTHDYLRHYAQEKSTQYVMLNVFLQQHPFVSLETILLLLPSKIGTVRTQFRSGTIVFDFNNLNQFAQYLMQIHSDRFRGQQRLQGALSRFWKIYADSKDRSTILGRLIKVINRAVILTPELLMASNTSGLVRIIIDLYNSGLSASKRLNPDDLMKMA